MATPPAGSALFFGADRLSQALARRLEDAFSDAAPRAEESLVVGLFGEWGSGKSTLLESLHDHFTQRLRQDQDLEHPAAYTVPIWFNAWRFEREEQLIVPLLKIAKADIDAAFKGGRTRDESFRDMAEARIDLISDLVIATARSLDVKLDVPGIGAIGPASPLEWFKHWRERRKERDDAQASEIERLKAAQFDFHSHLRALTGRDPKLFGKQIERIKRRAAAARDWTLPADGDEAARWQAAASFRLNLLFLIDDLDRCLPDKAVEMLEVIKLSLEVDGCAFVLALDDEVIERGIAHRYRDYLFHAERSAVAATTAAPITGAEYLEKIIQLPLRLTRPSRAQVDRFLAERWGDWFVDTDGAESGPAATLRQLVSTIVPPVPRKLVRTIELMRACEGIIAVRGTAADRSMLAVLVALQLFAPELYRFLRRRGADLLDQIVQWEAEGRFGNLAALEQSLMDELSKSTEAHGLYFKESLAQLPALVQACQRNRAGFDLRLLAREYGKLTDKSKVQSYFVLFSDVDATAATPAAEKVVAGTGATAGAATAAATGAASGPADGATRWIDAARAARVRAALPYAPAEARLENVESFLDGLLASDPRARTNAFTREAPALQGHVLPEALVARLEAECQTLYTRLASPDEAKRWLDDLAPFLAEGQAIALARASWPRSGDAAFERWLADWTSRCAAPPWAAATPDLPRLTGRPVSGATDEASDAWLFRRGWQFARDEPSAADAQWTGVVLACPFWHGAWLGPRRFVSGDEYGQVVLWTWSERNLWLPRLLGRHRLAVTRVVALRDGQRLVTASWDGTLRVWTLDNADDVSATVLASHVDAVKDVAITRDDRHAVSASYDGTLRVWSLDGGSSSVRMLTGHTGWVSRIAIGGADGDQAVSAAIDGTVRVWSLTGAFGDRVLAGHQGPVNDVAIARDGQCALTASDDQNVGWWDLSTTHLLAMLSGHRRSVRCVAVHDDGHLAVSGDSDGRIIVWDISGDMPRQSGELRGHSETIERLEFRGDGIVTSASQDGTVRVWNLAEGSNQPLAVLSAHTKFTRATAMRRTGTLALSFAGDTQLGVWRIEPPWSTRPVAMLAGRGDAETRAALSDDGLLLATTSSSGAIHLWSMDNDAATPRTLGVHGAAASHLAFNDVAVLGSAANDGVRLWHLAPDPVVPVRIGEFPLAGPVSRFVVTRRCVLAASAMHGVQLLASPYEVLATLKDSARQRLHAVDLNRDGERVVAPMDDDAIGVWDWTADAERPVARIHASDKHPPVHLARFSPDGRWLATASRDDALRLWDLDALKQEAEPAAIGRGHSGPIQHLVFSGDGQWLLSGSQDGSVRLWRRHAGELVAVGQQQLGAPVNHVLFGPRDAWAAACADDASVRLWRAPFDAGLSPLATLWFDWPVSWCRSGGNRFVCRSADAVHVWDGDPLSAQRLGYRMQLRALTGGIALRLMRGGLELQCERPIHCADDALGRRVPADPALAGVLAFHAGASTFELMQLAERIEWPDEAQPQRLRVRWRDEAEFERWMPPIEWHTAAPAA